MVELHREGSAPAVCAAGLFFIVNYYASPNNGTPQSSLVNIIDSMEHISEDLKSRAAVKLSHGEVLYTCTAQMLS